MNPFGISIEQYALALPHDVVISATELERLSGLADLDRAARARALVYMQRARSVRKHAREAGIRQGEERLHEIETQLRRHAETEVASAVRHAVTWHISVSEAQRRLVDSIESRCVNLLCEALTEFGLECDHAQLLASRLQPLIAELAVADPVTVTVHPDHIGALTRRFDALTVQWKADSDLSLDEARLDSPYAHVRLSLSRDIELLCAQLRAEPSPTTASTSLEDSHVDQ